MRTKRDLSPRLSSASVIAPARFYSQSKEGVRDCAKSRIENRGRNAQHLPSFLFFSPLFSENNAIHQSISRGGDPKHLRQQRKHARKRNSIRPTFLRKNKRRHSLPMPVLRTAERPTCVCLPPSLRFLRAQKNSYPSSDG